MNNDEIKNKLFDLISNDNNLEDLKDFEDLFRDIYSKRKKASDMTDEELDLEFAELNKNSSGGVLEELHKRWKKEKANAIRLRKLLEIQK